MKLKIPQIHDAKTAAAKELDKGPGRCGAVLPPRAYRVLQTTGTPAKLDHVGEAGGVRIRNNRIVGKIRVKHPTLPPPLEIALEYAVIEPLAEARFVIEV